MNWQLYKKGITVVLLLFLFSCKEKVYTPKVIYESPKREEVKPKDTSEVLVADLPIHFANTDVLLHPVGKIRSYSGKLTTYESGAYSYTITNLGDTEITGYLDNLLVQKITQDTLVPLLPEKKMITSITFLRKHFEKTQKPFLLMALYDQDTNKDQLINTNDIKAMYLSEIDGEKLTKISPDQMEWIDWNYQESLQRIYFRCVADTDQNGKFEKSDKVHYFYVDLKADLWEAKEYFPVGN
ncbi:MAG: hypothetical protein KGZ81_07505 [Flavobacteriales bacterium]|nr:hypothetical protein [Flavobacteriales bacterium]